MFFKKKIDVEDYCAGNLKALFSPEREGTYERLRQACADPALTSADPKLYFDHIRAVVIQLLLVAITKSCTPDISSDGQVCVMIYLRQQALSHIDTFRKIYNGAFGSQPQDGVAGMVEAFAREVTDSAIRPETAQRLYVEFYAILPGLFQDFESIKLTSRRR